MFIIIMFIILLLLLLLLLLLFVCCFCCCPAKQTFSMCSLCLNAALLSPQLTRVARAVTSAVTRVTDLESGFRQVSVSRHAATPETAPGTKRPQSRPERS